MVDAGLIVMCAFISPYNEDRARLRTSMPEGRFIECFVSCPLEVCEQRDVKGLYAKARNGEIKNFTGISSSYEEPNAPDIILKTAPSEITPELSASRIIAHLEARGLLP